MLVRRVLALFGLLLIVGLVFSLDLRILTDKALARIRIKSEIARVFHHESHFDAPETSLDGVHRLRNFRMRPSHGRYQLKAREIEVPLGIARQLIGDRPRQRAHVRGLRFRWRRGVDPGWGFEPFLDLCEELQASMLLPARLEDAEIVLVGGPTDPEIAVQLDEIEVKRVADGVQFSGRSSGTRWDRLAFNITADTRRRRFVGAVHFRALQLRAGDLWALPVPVAEALAPLRARRSADLDISLPTDGPMEVQIRPRNLSIRPESFPYPLRRITEGSIRVTEGGVELRGLRGQSAGMRFQIAGEVATGPTFEESRLQVQWSDMALDERLAAAVPDDFGWVWRRWTPTGSIGGNLTVSPGTLTDWQWEGTLALTEVRLPLEVPLTLDGRVAATYRDGELAVDLAGVVVRLAGLPVGTLATGELRVDRRRLLLSGAGAGGLGQTLRGEFRQGGEWPHAWRVELALGGLPLSDTLAGLLGTPASGPARGEWSGWLRASGDEASTSGRGEIWLHAPEGRRLPFLGRVFPPSPDRTEEVRGTARLVVEPGRMRVPRIDLRSGSETAQGSGEGMAGGPLRLTLLRGMGRGAAGPHPYPTGLPGDGRTRVDLEGPTPGPSISVRAVDGRQP